jgi:hypothetical protein
MIKAEVYKLNWAGQECENQDCKHSPEYHEHIIGDNYFIKQGTIVVRLLFTTGNSEFYCRDCIDIVYMDLKSALDSKLWAFK